jgi:hypothetical protein
VGPHDYPLVAPPIPTCPRPTGWICLPDIVDAPMPLYLRNCDLAYWFIGRRTFSAAQNTATAIERETNAIFVGEPTGSRPNFIGETIPFQLPYGKTLVNVADLCWQTSWPMDHRPWIAPELYAPPPRATRAAADLRVLPAEPGPGPGRDLVQPRAPGRLVGLQ